VLDLQEVDLALEPGDLSFELESACTWLFLDRSRNRSRRWCSMATCGNRAKARRHDRRRGSPSGPSGTLRPAAG